MLVYVEPQSPLSPYRSDVTKLYPATAVSSTVVPKTERTLAGETLVTISVKKPCRVPNIETQPLVRMKTATAATKQIAVQMRFRQTLRSGSRRITRLVKPRSCNSTVFSAKNRPISCSSSGKIRSPFTSRISSLISSIAILL